MRGGGGTGCRRAPTCSRGLKGKCPGCRGRPPHGTAAMSILLDHPGAFAEVSGEGRPPRPRHLLPPLRRALAVRVREVREGRPLPRDRVLPAEAGVLLPRVRRGASRGFPEVLGVGVFVSARVPVV